MPDEFKIGMPAGDVASIVESVFETMLGLDVSQGGEPWYPAPDRLTARVAISGAWNGTVVIECANRQACRLAGRYLSAQPRERADEVVRDVLGEIANMVGGNLKSVAVHGGLLSSPAVADGSDDCFANRGPANVDSLAFQSADGTFWIALVDQAGAEASKPPAANPASLTIRT